MPSLQEEKWSIILLERGIFSLLSADYEKKASDQSAFTCSKLPNKQ